MDIGRRSTFKLADKTVLVADNIEEAIVA